MRLALACSRWFILLNKTGAARTLRVRQLRWLVWLFHIVEVRFRLWIYLHIRKLLTHEVVEFFLHGIESGHLVLLSCYAIRRILRRQCSMRFFGQICFVTQGHKLRFLLLFCRKMLKHSCQACGGFFAAIVFWEQFWKVTVISVTLDREFEAGYFDIAIRINGCVWHILGAKSSQAIVITVEYCVEMPVTSTSFKEYGLRPVQVSVYWWLLPCCFGNFL